MGITPIGPLAMLPLTRSAGPELEPVPMARVERSARAEDETYSPSKEDRDSPLEAKKSANRQSGSEDKENELSEDEGFIEDGSNSAEPLTSAASSFDLPSDSLAKISFFA